MIPRHWTPVVRRRDGETVGYVRPDGAGHVPVNLLGIDLGEPMEAWEAEDVVLDRGMGDLGRTWLLDLDGPPREVVVVQIDPDGAIVQDAQSAKAMGAPPELRQTWTVALPASGLHRQQ